MRIAVVVPFVIAACTPADRPGFDVGTPAAERVVYDAPIPADATFHPSRVIVGFDEPGAPPSLAGAGGPLFQSTLRRLAVLRGSDVGVYEVPPGIGVREAVGALRNSGRYLYVEPDYTRTGALAVDDPNRVWQWHFDAVDAEGAWEWSAGSGVVVAVIDTGVTSGTGDGIATLGLGYDFANDDSDPSDDNGHGTHVAGTINQATDNGAGVAGLAWGASILPVKVLRRTGSGYTSDVVSGIDYAVASGADVINLSLGSSTYSATEAAAVGDAWDAGVFVACASGNGSASALDYPAGYYGAVAVGATDGANDVAWYSNGGAGLDLVAPGGDTSVDLDGDGYVDGVLQETFSRSVWGYYFFQGTSMATPHVAAAAALLMANGATNDEALAALEDTALDLGTSGYDTTYGYGLIQPSDALAAWDGGSTGGTTNTPPVADAGGPYSGETSASISFDGTASADSDGTVVSWAWNFGDGTTGSGSTATHAYDLSGTYSVSLTVTDDDGDTSVASTTATVADPVASCTVSITRLNWNARKRQLSTTATCTDSGATLAVYADGTDIGDMSYSKKRDTFDLTVTLSSKPEVVEVASSCGGTDSGTP